MKREEIVALLEASKITDSQDVAAFYMFMTLVMQFQKGMGLSDEKISRFVTVIHDYMSLVQDEKIRK